MKITESQLRQLIKEVLLTESAKTVEDLPKDAKVYVSISDFGGMVKFIDQSIEGSIQFRSSLGRNKPYVVEITRLTSSGFGPLLYDIALELCGSRGLMPDREEVSKDAWNIWNYYMMHRADVRKVQMDNPHNKLTPLNDDNVPQLSSEEDAFSSSWIKSPLSKAYFKEGTPILDKLKMNNKLYDPY